MPPQEKPALSFWQIWNICFGFLGIQFGFALQSANISRIFQTLGADIDAIPILFIAAPLTGLIVQPLVGYFSDKTWTRMGRRRPYFFWGALLSTGALIAMPNSPSLWVAAGMLWILDAAINLTTEPFRAFVGDMLPSRQRTFGYVMQSFFIGVGAVVTSALPYLFTEFLGVANTAPEGELPDSVRYSFYVGAAALLGAVIWTVHRTREYSPEELARFKEPANAIRTIDLQRSLAGQAIFNSSRALLWVAAGLLLNLAVFINGWHYPLYILSIGATVFGLAQLYAARVEKRRRSNGFYAACRSIFLMPQTMRQLAVAHFFSWFALFTLWIYATPAVTAHFYGSSDTRSAAYNEGANWVGLLFAAYNGFSILAALVIPTLVRRMGLKRTHQLNLMLGALGFASFLSFKDPAWLMLSMVGIGFAWASILSLPYAMLSDAAPADKMGLYMGVFNCFIVIPQLVAASLLGTVLREVFNGQAIYMLGFAAAMWVFAAISVFFIGNVDRPAERDPRALKGRRDR